MNRRMIFYTVGRIITLEAGLLLLPMAVALWYGESCAWDLLASAAIALVVGRAMTRLSKPTSQTFFAREGFVIVALAWGADVPHRDAPFSIQRRDPVLGGCLL